MSDAAFSREISILRACRDTNILQFQGVCFQDNRTLLVTECEWSGARGQRAVLYAAGAQLCGKSPCSCRLLMLAAQTWRAATWRRTCVPKK